MQGIVRLKRIAALGGLGTIGKSTLFISPRYGTRLVLFGIATEMDAGLSKIPLAVDFCRNCGRYVRSFPGGAIGPGGLMHSGAGEDAKGEKRLRSFPLNDWEATGKNSL